MRLNLLSVVIILSAISSVIFSHPLLVPLGDALMHPSHVQHTFRFIPMDDDTLDEEELLLYFLPFTNTLNSDSLSMCPFLLPSVKSKGIEYIENDSMFYDENEDEEDRALL
jgi:hypothetical protein